MDPRVLTMVLELLVNAAGTPVGERVIAAAQSPRTADLTAQRSLGETAEAILKCYHPSGHFRATNVAERPWSGANQFNATSSMLLRIEWSGAILKKSYTMGVAILERDNQIRTVVQDDNAMVPRSPRCTLNRWQSTTD